MDQSLCVLLPGKRRAIRLCCVDVRDGERHGYYGGVLLFAFFHVSEEDLVFLYHGAVGFVDECNEFITLVLIVQLADRSLRPLEQLLAFHLFDGQTAQLSPGVLLELAGVLLNFGVHCV